MRVFTYLLLFSAILAWSSAARATSERLAFGQPISDTSRQALDVYFATDLHTNSANMAVAAADLNSDGLSEYIVRDKACDRREQACHFTVLAENDGKITLLGDIPARELTLSDQTVQGVRSLLAYENAINDYDYTVYVWEPAQARYMITGQK